MNKKSFKNSQTGSETVPARFVYTWQEAVEAGELFGFVEKRMSVEGAQRISMNTVRALKIKRTRMTTHL